MTSVQSDYRYWSSLLNPVDLVTMVALAAIMMVVERRELSSLKDAWRIMIIAALPLLMWAAACAGMSAPAWLRYLGMFVILGSVLATREGFSFLGAVMAATVLIVVNVGASAVMSRVTAAAVGAAVGSGR